MKTKEELLKSSIKHEQLIKEELTDISNKTTEIVRNLAIIGAVIGGAFIVYKIFADEETSTKPGKKQAKSVSESAFSRFAKLATQKALLYVLAGSKEKIQNYINELTSNDHNS